MEREKLIGTILILLGIFLILTTFNIIPGSSIILIFALGFLYVYYKLGRNIGFLVPGCILLAVGIYTILQELWNLEGVYFLLFLGLAFVYMFFIHTSKFSKGEGEKYWPLYPGLILIGISLVLIFNETLSRNLNLIIPLLLIIIGLIITLRKK